MRTLPECKAEIFRRSKQIREKRRRMGKHILLGCIPVILCVAVWSVSTHSQKEVVGASDPHFYSDGSILTGGVCLYREAELQNPKSGSRKITDAAAVADLLRLIQSFAPDETAAPGGKTEQTPDTVPNHSSAMGSALRIVFYGSDGNTCTYLLNGSSLINQETGTQLTLSETQLATLQAALALE